MNFEKIEIILNDPFKRRSFLARLKETGETSQEMNCIKKMINKFQITAPPPGIFQRTILQHTFQFCEATECFQGINLVCKSWNTAVETTKFRNQSPPEFVFKKIPPSLKRLSKIVSVFDHLSSKNFDHKYSQNLQLFNILSNNMKFSKELSFFWKYESDFHPKTNAGAFFPHLKSLFLDLIFNHKDSLKTLSCPLFILPEVDPLVFSNLKEIKISLTPVNFANTFDLFEKCMQKFQTSSFPKIITLKNLGNQNPIIEYIKNNFRQNIVLTKYACIRDKCLEYPLPKTLPVKCLELVPNLYGEGCGSHQGSSGRNRVQILNGLHFFRKNHPSWLTSPWEYGKQVQYLKIEGPPKYFGGGIKFDSFKLLLEQLPNLKGICIEIYLQSSSMDKVQCSEGVCVEIHSPPPIKQKKVSIFSGYDLFLKSKEIQNLTLSEYNSKVSQLCKDLQFIFDIRTYCCRPRRWY